MLPSSGQGLQVLGAAGLVIEPAAQGLGQDPADCLHVLSHPQQVRNDPSGSCHQKPPHPYDLTRGQCADVEPYIRSAGLPSARHREVVHIGGQLADSKRRRCRAM
jgi:hypothetical protein